MKIVTAEEMRKIDRECIHRGTPVSVLMENAGRAVAEETIKHLGTLENQHILCLIGAGNNGGDGLVAARVLRERGAHIAVYICASRPDDDTNLALARESGVTCIDAAGDNSLKNFIELVAGTTCVIDALLGTGRARPLEGIFRRVLEKVTNERKKRDFKIIAIDLPSGMDADTGAVDPACLHADLTVTLAFPKLGLFNFPGAEMAGRLKIIDIGIPPALANRVTIELITADWARSILPVRSLDANKGTFGRVLVAGGSTYYIGAAYLACSGAMRVGAGLVTLATARSLQPILASKLTEATYLPLPESKPGIIGAEAAEVIMQYGPRYDVLLFGCGLGQDPTTVEFVSSLIFEKELPLPVLDADALNILPQIPEWWQWLTDDAILTPHPGEMSRLCGLTIDEIQSDRLNIARRYAAEWHQTIVLKGAYTVVANTDGRCRVSPFANPGLASAGTGDVLAGCIAGMVAQGLSPFDAASLGVYLHGAAGEMVKEKLGDTGMIASDLLPALPVTIKQLKNGLEQE
jgi:ADP-dependent NAD(P)H-hydrate dehydratase / NAD(P)H-hydrate epimerase